MISPLETIRLRDMDAKRKQSMEHGTEIMRILLGLLRIIGQVMLDHQKPSFWVSDQPWPIGVVKIRTFEERNALISRVHGLAERLTMLDPGQALQHHGDVRNREPYYNYTSETT